MREWQQTRFKDLVMPDAVYYQTIWAVRDLDRMEEKLDKLDQDIKQGSISTTSLVRDGEVDYHSRKHTEDKAIEKALLEMRVNAIKSALMKVPPMYRQFIMDSIVMHKGYGCFPNKLWRLWKQRFLFNVAKNLELM